MKKISRNQIATAVAVRDSRNTAEMFSFQNNGVLGFEQSSQKLEELVWKRVTEVWVA